MFTPPAAFSRRLLPLLAMLLVAGACSTDVTIETVGSAVDPAATTPGGVDGADELDPPASPSTGATPSEEAAPEPAETPDAPPAETEAPEDPQPDAPQPEGPLNVAARGERVAVAGVAADGSVPVRSSPRPRAEVIVRLPPLFDAVIGTGEGRTQAGTNWWRVRVGEDEGWVDAASLVRLGATTDITDTLLDAIGDVPRADTMRALGRIVARTRSDTDPAPTVVISVAPRAGAVGEIAYDIVSAGDGPAAGERLVVQGAPDGTGEGFVLTSVESTAFCSRGVTGDGRCT